MSLADQSLQFFPVSARVSVLRARGLRVKGKDGTNDAYAALQAGRETFRTSVSEKRAEPVWGGDAAAFIFTLPPESARAEQDGVPLQVRVLHRVPLGADKLLGLTVIDVHELRQNSARENPQWFKLLNKAGKADKERGEILLDIQFLKSSMSISMIDLSDKSHSRLGKFKDKLKGKKKEGLSDSASAILPSVSQVLTDSEGEMDGEMEGESTKKKKNKLKSLFVPKSNMKRNSMSQSMSSLGTLPDKNSSISSSTSSGLNVDSTEGKKKKKLPFLTHKRSGSRDKASNHGDVTLGSTNQNPPSPIAICINGSPVFREETQSEDMQEMEEVEKEEEEQERLEEERRREAEEEKKRQVKEEERKKEEEEKERIRMESEKEEQKRRMEEEGERLRMEEEERERLRMERQKEEQRKLEEERERLRMEERERLRMEKEEQRRMEEEERERLRMEEEERERLRMEEEEQRERLRMERQKEEQRKLEEERERLRMEEQERLRIEREKEEQRRIEEEERERIRLEQEKEEQRIRDEEGERRRMEREKEEQRRMEEERERIRMEGEREEQRRMEEERERLRMEEEERERIRLEREKEEQRIRMEEEGERMRMEREKEEQRRMEEEGERMRMESEKEEQRRMEEERERIRMEREKEEQRIRMEEEEKERIRMEQEKEEQRIRMEEEEKDRIRMEREKEEQRRMEEEEKERIRIEKEAQRRKLEQEEKIRIAEEEGMKEEKKSTEGEQMMKEEEKQKLTSTDFTRSARISNVKPSVSVSATVSQLFMANTNPFLDDCLDASISENVISVKEATAKKRRAPLPPQKKPVLTGPDVSTRWVPEQHSLLTEFSKCPAPQPPGILKMTSEVTVKENMAQVGLGQEPRKIPETYQESSVSSVSQDDTQVDLNPFTCDEPVAVKHKKPAPKPGSGISMSEGKPRNGGKNLTEGTVHLEEKTSASNDQKLLSAPNDIGEDVKSDLTDLSWREQHLEDLVEPDSAKLNAPSCVSPDLCPEPLGCKTDGLPGMERSQKKYQAPLPPAKPKRSGDPSTPHQQPSLLNKTNLEQTLENHSNKKDQENSWVSSVEIPADSTPSSTVSSSTFTPLAEKSQVMKPCAIELVETDSGSGSRTLSWAKVVPSDVGEVREQVAPTSVIRQHAVKPLSAAENLHEIHESRVTDNTQPKMKAAEGAAKGPYSQLTQAELISLALRQQEQLSQRDARIQELESYIDNLLVRVIEEKPSILMTMNAVNKSM